MTTSIYKQALQMQLRFETRKGLLSVEDLFRLPLSQGQVNLKDLALSINTKLNKQSTDIPDFLKDDAKLLSSDQKLLQLQLDILKDIILSRKEEIAELDKANKISQQKQFLKELIVKKRQESIENLSLEELEKQLKDLG